MGAEIVSAVATGVFLFLAVVVLFSLGGENRQKLLAYLVGIAAGLVAAQVLQVHLFTITVVIWCLFSRRLSGSWTPPEVVLPLVSAALLASTALYGELVNSPTLGLQLLAFAGNAALLALFGNARDIRTMMYGLLTITSLSSAWALLQVAGIAPNDSWHLDVSAIGRPTGFYPEPDWLGMFAGIGLVLAWRLDLRRWYRVVLITTNLAAWVLAFARAGWVAVGASVALAITVSVAIKWRNQKRDLPIQRVATPPTGRAIAVMVSVAVGIVAFETIPSLQENIMTRLSRTFTVQAGDISAQARVQQNDGLLYLAQTAPWNGWGLSASGRVGVSGRLTLDGEATNNLGSNWVLAMWVDGAWIALPLIVTLVLAAALSVSTLQGQLLVVVLLNSFFSNATFQPVTWLLVGACLYHIRQRREQTVGSARPPDFTMRRHSTRVQT